MRSDGELIERAPSSLCGMRSARKAAGVEEGLLLRPGGAAQRRVAVREPPEATDDVGMLLGVCHELIVAVTARELNAAFLIGEIFRVHQRQIEELALAVRDPPVEPASDGTIGDGAGDTIALVGALVAAKHVARELVEHDDERERTLGRLLPGRERAVAAGLPEARKAQRDLGVEGRVLLEPLVGSGRAPECEHLHWSDRLGSAGAGAGDHSRTSPALIRS